MTLILGACLPVAQPTGSPAPAVAEATVQPTEQATPEAAETEAPTPEATEDRTPEPVTAGCLPVEEPEQLPETHLSEGDTFDDYSSDPPSSGPHSPDWEEEGTYAFDEVTVERLVHSIEHGTVILWTSGLSAEETEAAEEAMDAIKDQGYGALIVVHDYPMDARLVMTAWGFYQECGEVDEEAMQDFVDAYYASGPSNGEGAIACATHPDALPLPGCEKWVNPSN
ncbi:MAG: DUF3105 domain-containing protein [Dehalococcoidia bacterium]